MTTQGYSGPNYDKWVERTETSTLHKMKETFWTTKQAVIQKLGKKEDEHVVASDSELDSKLEVFRAIQKSSMGLLRVLEKYQDRLCVLSQEENATGRFLKSQSNLDKTRAGKMMAAVGKSQSFAAQQRLSLRVPLVRLYQEVETFRYRAISDTLMTINRMEAARTEYRGALLWMKNISEELDPDTYKQLEKFRKVQAQVRKTKAKFDKLKLDVMQKVDLLAASRCNMFSHVLANYQSTLLHFWEKTSRTMTAVAESFKGYQYYEFNIIKELAEPSKKLSEETSKSEPAERDTADEEFDPSNCKKCTSRKSNEEWQTPVSRSTDQDDESEGICPECGHFFQGEGDNYPITDLEQNVKTESSLPSQRQELYSESSEENRLIAFDEEEGETESAEIRNDSLQNLYDMSTENQNNSTDLGNNVKDSAPFIEMEDDSGELKDEDFDFSGAFTSSEKPAGSRSEKVISDLLADDLPLGQDDTDKDDLTILNEILNAPSTGGDDFSKEWQAVFGTMPLSTGTTYTQGETDQAEFMPSNLLDLNKQMSGMSLSQSTPSAGAQTSSKPPVTNKSQPQQTKSKTSKQGRKDMSAWFSLFADLDPLSNPDAVGKTSDDMQSAQF
ncbi:islet cell autoantigen 1-like isoform X1 [Saccostrea echinata]|uniref:islet cell autoantigen 1-like isoform X1 n=1 Tax=Saccostrea echinata TaxID=191078 RepID=UPI002A82DA51|nr:islet cell autoantigen 1-like isoform X1 [Saccostrea echinata]